MKYIGITKGKILEGFCLLPSINITWMKITIKGKKYYDIQFAWLFWFFTIGTIPKVLKELDIKVMEKEDIKVIEGKLDIMCFILVFLVGLSLVINWSLYKKVDNLSIEVTQIEKQIDTIYLNYPLENIVTLTVYNPVESQCDDTPLITASGIKIDLEKLKKGEIKYCAVSRDLLAEIPYGSIIYIEGHGKYQVVDTMNKRFKNSVDILQDVSEKGFKKTNIRILKVK